MKLLFFVGFIVLISTVSEAAACSCLDFPIHSVDFGKSKAVFIREVMDDNQKMSSPESLHSTVFKRAVKFRVEKSWKGAKGAEFTAWAGYAQRCGFKPEAGEKYLVYVRRYKDNYVFHTSCSGTRPIEESGQMIKEMKQLSDAWFRFRSNFAYFNFR